MDDIFKKARRRSCLEYAAAGAEAGVILGIGAGAYAGWLRGTNIWMAVGAGAGAGAGWLAGYVWGLKKTSKSGD